MKTNIPFYHKVTDVVSNCGEPLDITLSSHLLNWEGVLVERGTSPYFHPKDVVTPNFYFAIEMENTYSWDALKSGEKIALVTEPGDIWINPPNTPFTHNIDMPCHFLIVNISAETMYSHFSGQLPDSLEFLNNYNIQDKTLEHLMYLLLFEVENKGKNGSWYLKHLLKLYSNYFIRHYSNYNDLISEQTTSTIIRSQEMTLINQYITKNIMNPITIEELALEINVSKFHFLKEFKKYNGLTPYQYIMNIRIDEATERLKNTSDRITTIAYDLGFSDSSHFSRTYKRVTGKSPNSIRKENPSS